MFKTTGDDCRWLTFPSFGKENENLVFLEGMKDLPFEIQRVYYQVNLKENDMRGKHAHKHSQQVIIAVQGSFTLTIKDGESTKNFNLDNPHNGVYIPQGLWRELSNFEDGSIVMTLDNKAYVAEDYIKDFEIFKLYKKLGEEKYEDKYKALSRKWLTDPELKALTATPDFSISQQEDFFRELPQRKDYMCWGITFDQKPIGLYTFKHLNADQTDIILILGEKEFWGKGLGMLLLDELVIKARDMKLKRICLDVLIDNKRAIRLYEKYGFQYIFTKENKHRYQLELL